jgi:hypothetical protein
VPLPLPVGVAALRVAALDHAVEDQAVVEAERRQVDDARAVHRRLLRVQQDLELADVRRQLPVVLAVVEGQHLGRGQVLLPIGLALVDPGAREVLVELRERRLGGWSLLGLLLDRRGTRSGRGGAVVAEQAAVRAAASANVVACLIIGSVAGR